MIACPTQVLKTNRISPITPSLTHKLGTANATCSEKRLEIGQRACRSALVALASQIKAARLVNSNFDDPTWDKKRLGNTMARAVDR